LAPGRSTSPDMSTRAAVRSARKASGRRLLSVDTSRRSSESGRDLSVRAQALKKQSKNRKKFNLGNIPARSSPGVSFRDAWRGTALQCRTAGGADHGLVRVGMALPFCGSDHLRGWESVWHRTNPRPSPSAPRAWLRPAGMTSVQAMSSGRLTRSFSPAWRFRIDVADVLRDVRLWRTPQDDRGQARVAEVLADRGVR